MTLKEENELRAENTRLITLVATQGKDIARLRGEIFLVRETEDGKTRNRAKPRNE
jgi:hypothetical protein